MGWQFAAVVETKLRTLQAARSPER